MPGSSNPRDRGSAAYGCCTTSGPSATTPGPSTGSTAPWTPTASQELAALKRHAERGADGPGEGDTFLTFEDTVRLEGHVKDVYDFIDQAQHWAERLPHVTAVNLQENTAPGVQILAMDTLTKDGSPHTTESVRVCVPYERIVYKQTTLPRLMALHTGEWGSSRRTAPAPPSSPRATPPWSSPPPSPGSSARPPTCRRRVATSARRWVRTAWPR
ncbi:hypothetical protein STANM309S_04378 [Streptomyces tanashiensis]